MYNKHPEVGPEFVLTGKRGVFACKSELHKIMMSGVEFIDSK